MEPRRFLATAELLTDPDATESEEADWRSAVSRAYYAAFLEARELLKHMGFEPYSGGKAHIDVQEHYRASAFKQELGYEIDKRLGELLEDRGVADYVIDENTTFSLEDALYHVALAWEVVEKLDECRGNSSVRSEVEKSIGFWRTGRRNRGNR